MICCGLGLLNLCGHVLLVLRVSLRAGGVDATRMIDEVVVTSVVMSRSFQLHSSNKVAVGDKEQLVPADAQQACQVSADQLLLIYRSSARLKLNLRLFSQMAVR